MGLSDTECRAKENDQIASHFKAILTVRDIVSPGTSILGELALLAFMSSSQIDLFVEKQDGAL